MSGPESLSYLFFAARRVQFSSAVWGLFPRSLVIIGIDSLNRLTSKAYADSYTSTPTTATVKYGYDGAALTGCASDAPPADTDSYPKERRTSMCDGSGGTSWTHDQMGRIKQERRSIAAVLGKYDTDTYNLDGSVATQTVLGYGITFTYNRAGRAITAKGGDSFTYLSGATYAPSGGLATASMGSAPVTISNTYNSRLQPILISAAASSSIISLCYDFHSATAISAGPCSFPANSTGDNGNVFKIVNNRDSNRTQNFLYDSLNRISQRTPAVRIGAKLLAQRRQIQAYSLLLQALTHGEI